MSQYVQALEKVAEKEMTHTVFYLVILLLITGLIWLCNYQYFKNMKTKHPQMFCSKAQKKIRRRSIWASVALTIICIGSGILLYASAQGTVSDIRKDIEERAFVTYNGEYYVYNGYNRRVFDKWMNVDLYDGGVSALAYMDSFSEWISTYQGEYEGQVVYGKNSLIVVSMEVAE